MIAGETIIELDGVTKRFGGVVALDRVSFSIRRGEVHALVGENGAGKSTLMKLLAGVHPPDEGRVLIDGVPVRLTSPREARRQGVSIVFQELNLFPRRTVTANVFAGREATGRWGLIDHRAMQAVTRRVLDQLEVNISPQDRVERLSIGERQLVEIARALAHDSRIVILDEPNSALTETESRRLFEIVRRLRSRGITVIYVSHRLEEVFAIADAITVIRDGRFQSTSRVNETTIPDVIAAMIGRRLDQSFPDRPPQSAAAPVALSVRELRGKRLGPVSFEVRAGEIVGFAGLEGAGVDELFHVLFGLAPMTGGEVTQDKTPYRPRSPAAAIRRGWGMIPASRRDEGLMMDWSIRRNATLLALDRLVNRLGLLSRRAMTALTDESIARLKIVADSQDQRVVNLSGGNQQKVLLARWLATKPRVLILNDPTRGIDVGAKAEIYSLCRQLAQAGLAILLASSEAEEILGLADRTIVLANGRIRAEFPRGQAAKAELLHAIACEAGTHEA